jgi:hypothetical protein
MRPPSTRLAALGLVILAQLGPATFAQAVEKGKLHPQSGSVRLARDSAGKVVGLETALIRCVPRDCGRTGPTVDLVGAVHVADRAYYERLNREFGTYDAVLYELVAKENTRIPLGGVSDSKHPLVLLQKMLQDVLELDFQLERVDYTKSNMIRADMTPQQLADSMSKRGESMMTMLLRLLGYALVKEGAGSGGLSDFNFLLALLEPQRSLALKRLLAEELLDIEGLTDALGGRDGSSLIEERNKVAVGVLRKQIAAGKKKLAVFYGCGHLPDLQRRLGEECDLVPVDTRWLTAWDLKGRPPAGDKKSPPKLKEMFDPPK